MKNNPYVGPKPYEFEDSGNFYGRDHEARELRALIVANREVLFYAQSGAGKTSLLNAQVIPALKDKGFKVLPPVRVGSALPPHVSLSDEDNVFIFSTLVMLDSQDTAPQTMLQHTLYSFLEQHYPEKASHGTTPQPLVLIFDQFEELFTTHRDRWQDAKGFFQQVRDALDKRPDLGVVFAMRQDHVAEIDPYVSFFPRRLRARFHMERLGIKGALAAIARPAENAGCRYDPGVAEKLVDNLRQIRMQHHQAQDGEETAPLGPYVEPVQLQVVCHRLWENMPEQADHAIQWQEVEQYGNIDRALRDFYDSALAAALNEKQVDEHQLRAWFEQQLITQAETRGLVLYGSKDTGGLPNAAVDVLEAQHIIRADVRAGARWVELVHDRLVDPILQANEEWHQAHPLIQAAREWQDS
ncbi:MAG: hypothetical protein JXA89_23445, partial [Anaerolineae bacterium]|nr:hypothetical protein [Anaerolineae bacterium]